MTEQLIRRHVIVRGQVQGVGFRWSADARARDLGLAGWVRNRSDGTVEAEIQGTEEQVDAMLEWLHRGPQFASVTAVEVSEATLNSETGFSIR